MATVSYERTSDESTHTREKFWSISPPNSDPNSTPKSEKFEKYGIENYFKVDRKKNISSIH